jgi:hypothetical protein
MSRRAALSGLGFELYAVSRTALSFTLQGKHVSAGGQLRRQVVGAHTRSVSSCPWGGVPRPLLVLKGLGWALGTIGSLTGVYCCCREKWTARRIRR